MAEIGGLGPVLEQASQSSQSTSGRLEEDEDLFVQMLVATLQNQLPGEEAIDATELLNQQVGLATVETLEAIEGNIENLLSTQSLNDSSSLIGNVVDFRSTNIQGEEEILTGIVGSVQFDGGSISLMIDGNPVDPEDVVEVLGPFDFSTLAALNAQNSEESASEESSDDALETEQSDSESGEQEDSSSSDQDNQQEEI